MILVLHQFDTGVAYHEIDLQSLQQGKKNIVDGKWAYQFKFV